MSERRFPVANCRACPFGVAPGDQAVEGGADRDDVFCVHPASSVDSLVEHPNCERGTPAWCPLRVEPTVVHVDPGARVVSDRKEP